MKLINQLLRHIKDGFTVYVKTCNRRVVTTENTETGEIVTFNRQKLEWMIKNKVFDQVGIIDEIDTFTPEETKILLSSKFRRIG